VLPKIHPKIIWMGAHTGAYGGDMARSKEHATVTKKPAESLISTADAAARIGMAEITLRLWRWRDNPHQPPYVRIGPHRVRYDVAALDKWLESRTHQPGSKARSKDRSPGRHRGRPGPRG
jgi:predicted DNA-binding transcriptional regulator AlpA